MNTSTSSTSLAWPWLKLSFFLTALSALVLIPFVLWGDQLESASPLWMHDQSKDLWLAALGIVLLVVDVLLPIPSSIVGMALCWTLGPLWGGMSLAIGLWLSYIAGYLLGRLLPQEILRQWIGETLWDKVKVQARGSALWWIVLARPLPMLAEMSAILSGVWRIPPTQALSLSALSSAIVAALYAVSAWMGQQSPETFVILFCLSAMPSLAWVLHHVWIRRIQRPKRSAP